MKYIQFDLTYSYCIQSKQTDHQFVLKVLKIFFIESELLGQMANDVMCILYQKTSLKP